jgi:hypothetical protein
LQKVRSAEIPQEKPMLPATATRVRESTAEATNRRIEAQTERNVYYFADHPDEIGRRLDELDQEWDIERALEANAAALAFGGVLLGAFVDRRLLLLPALVTGFLLQHALQGWCPPVPLFRRRGFRTENEIDRERYALKAVRGDFRIVAEKAPARRRADMALDAVRA